MNSQTNLINKPKAIVLLSSGLDSTMNLWMAMKEFEVVMALTFDYGQVAALKEIECSKRITEVLNIPHKVMNVQWISEVSRSSLNRFNKDNDVKIPTGDQVQIDNHQVSKQTAKSVWVPNRNGFFLNLAAVFADSFNTPISIIPGFNEEEAKTFPDNSLDFINALNACFKFSTINEISVKCYTIEMSKTEIVKQGVLINFPFEKIWPCYFNFDKWCGKCESCLRSKRAFDENNLNLKECFL